jgi:hypothetical protein
MVVAMVAGLEAGRQIDLDQLEVPFGLRGQDFDARRVSACRHPRALAGADHAGYLILLDHQVRRRRVERAREIVQGRERRGRSMVLNLTDEPFGESRGPCELLHGEAAAKPEVANLLTQLHGGPPRGVGSERLALLIRLCQLYTAVNVL